MSRFFGRIGVTLKKGAHRARARPEQDQHDARTLMNFLDGHPTDGHQSVRNQHDPSRI